MPRNMLAAAFAAFIAGAFPAYADDTFIAAQKMTEYLAKDRLVGAKVHGADGKIVGDIEDLIIDGDNKIVGVVMGVGGVLGLGEKKVGITLSALSIEATDGNINVALPAATKEALTAAPAFQRATPRKGWLQRAVEKGQELKDKTSVTVKDAYSTVKIEAGPALEKAKEKARDVVEKARQAAKPAGAAQN